MSYSTLNGARISSATITIPYYGAWVADVIVATADVIPSQGPLVVGDLSLFGTIYRQAAFAGSREVRVVGGYGGWRNTLPAQTYQSASGVKLSVVLGDAAAIVGEKIKIANDGTLGTIFVRENAPAERLLRQLAGAVWWVDSSGKTQVGPRPVSKVGNPFSAIGWKGGAGRVEIATEVLSEWMPGATFSNGTVTPAQTIGMTSIEVDNDGVLRLVVLVTS